MVFESTIASAWLKTKTHSKPLRLTVAAYRRCTALYSAPWQAHAANSGRSSLHWLLAARPFATVWASVPHSLASFLAAGAITFS